MLTTEARARRSVIYNRRTIRFIDRLMFGMIGALLAGAVAMWSDGGTVPAVVLVLTAAALWWLGSYGVYMHKVQLDAAEQVAERVEHWPPPRS